jgi:TrmH family RNA methyltransferase
MLARPRKRETSYLLEGKKLIEVALAARAPLTHAIVSESLDDSHLVEQLAGRGIAVFQVTDANFRRISSQTSPEGILALAERPRAGSFTLPADGVVLLAAGVADPGNLGALARVCEASGARGLILTNECADPYSPKAMRGAMGSLLRVPVFETDSSSEAIALLEEHGYRLVASVPRGGVDFREADWTRPLAICVGRESTGLPRELLAASGTKVRIPMSEPVESLNVVAAATLLLYEAAR